MNDTRFLSQIRALIIDIDGTLWCGDVPLPGLAEFFDFLQQRRINYVIVTNNTVNTPAQYRQKLAGFRVRIDTGRILTAATATADYLTRNFDPRDSVFVIGQSGLRQAIRAADFTIATDAGQPAAAVVVGGDRKLTYDKLKYAVLLIQRGAAFIGTNPDLLIPTEEGLVPEAGTTLAAIQAATNVSPTVIGKPQSILFDIALARLATVRDQTAMLGDRLDTDIVGGQRAGLKTIMVTTGVDNRATAAQKDIKPDAIFSGLEELVTTWTSVGDEAISRGRSRFST